MKRAKTILTTGVFDVLHPGHIYLLRYASRLKGRNGRLIVIVARDETVRRRKRRPPIFSDYERLILVKSLRFVDDAHLGYRPFSFKRVIERFRPDVVVFGYDQDKVRSEFMEEMRREGWRVKVVKAPKMSSARLNSSSKVLAKIAKLVVSGKLPRAKAAAQKRSSRG
ncbi:MAG: adenylyltransferase/cytidyltransferase family protein [Nitrososphaerota archaeon]|nr:FAD synthase [Candidatus Calditenuaceae archaeon]MDW8073842.1 adenylyltransferase/cytidyltransferase family protein [Nitrososphaerota archaeon]